MFNVVKAEMLLNPSVFICKLIGWILTVSVVHSCFMLYEMLLLQFIKSLQYTEGNRTDVLTDLQPLF